MQRELSRKEAQGRLNLEMWREDCEVENSDCLFNASSVAQTGRGALIAVMLLKLACPAAQLLWKPDQWEGQAFEEQQHDRQHFATSQSSSTFCFDNAAVVIKARQLLLSEPVFAKAGAFIA